MNTRFTIEEENIVAIYAEDSRETTLENILAAMPYMDEDIYRRFQLCFVACPLLFGGVFCIAFSLVLSRYDDG